MPQATDEQRARWVEPDGSIGEHRPVKYLQDHGYKLLPNWHWLVPVNHIPTETELDAMGYMVNEWDYGGYIYAGD